MRQKPTVLASEIVAKSRLFDVEELQLRFSNGVERTYERLVGKGKSRLTLDADSRLARLEQDGWQIEYTRYAEQNGYWLPERLKLHGQDLDVTLVIKDWQPRQLGR